MTKDVADKVLTLEVGGKFKKVKIAHIRALQERVLRGRIGVDEIILVDAVLEHVAKGRGTWWR